MARRTKQVVIQPGQVFGHENRDVGKVFIVTEMSARVAEKWAFRMMEALAKSGMDLPEAALGSGMAGIAGIGIRTVLGAPFSITEALLDEMFLACVGIVPNPKNPGVVRGAPPPGVMAVGPLIDDDTEEVTTRLLLRSEVLELHVGFSPAAFLTQRWEQARAALDVMQSTQTSDSPSPPSSPEGS